MTNEKRSTLTEPDGTGRAAPSSGTPALLSWEWPAVIGAAVVSMAVVGFLSRRLWFLDDSWDFLTGRSLADVGTWLEPHAGHWQSTTVLIYQALYPLFGLDYWPYYVPRLVGYAALCVLAWYVLRRRGADPILAFGSLLVLLVLGTSGFHNLGTFNNFIALTVLLVAATMLDEKPAPQSRDRWALFGFLVLALASSSLSIALVAGVAVAVTITGRLARWWKPLAGAMGVYAAWWLLFGRSERETPDLTLDAFLAIPQGIYDVMRYALANTLSVPTAFGAMLTLAVVVGVVWLGMTGRLGVFELSLLITLVVFLALVVVARVHPGLAFPNAERYGFNVAFILIPVFVPHIRVGRHPALQIGAVVVVALIALGNLAELQERLDWWEERAQASRAVVETTAYLIASGEPGLSAAGIDRPRSGVLTVARTRELLEHGWRPPGPTNQALVAAARAQLRMRVTPTGSIRGTRPRTDIPLDAGCASIVSAQPLLADHVGASTIRLAGPDGSAALVTWSDRFGVADRVVTFPSGPLFLRLAAPQGPTTLSIAPEVGPVTVCGLAAR